MIKKYALLFIFCTFISIIITFIIYLLTGIFEINLHSIQFFKIYAFLFNILYIYFCFKLAKQE